MLQHVQMESLLIHEEVTVDRTGIAGCFFLPGLKQPQWVLTPIALASHVTHRKQTRLYITKNDI